jgi:protein-disulfide isomerase
MRQAAEKAKSVRPVDQARDHIYGKPDAPLSLIEYSDFECPYCKQFHAIPKALVDASDGQLNWVYRHFPLRFHNPAAQKAAEASECANELGGQKAFWAFTDGAYARTQSNGKGFDPMPLVKELGLAEVEFQKCLDSGKFATHVNQDLEEGVNSGITGTPGTILRNNRTGEVRLKPGMVPAAALKTDMEQMLAPHPTPKK